MERFDNKYKIHTLMKYATSKKKEVLDAALASSNYCIQLKRDGASYIWSKDLDGTVHLYKDSISKKTGDYIDKIENVPHLKDFAEKHFPNGSQILVEICYGDKSADVNTIMLALPPKAIQRQNETKLAEAYIFDILYWNGDDVYGEDFEQRWDLMGDIWEWDFFADSHPPIWLSIATTYKRDKAEKITEWLAAGFEGGVLKMLRSTEKVSAAHAVREIGATAARPMHTTFKIKQVDTVDVVVMDVTYPTSEYTGKDAVNHAYKDEKGKAINRFYALGMINAFTIGAYDENNNLIKIGTVASGLDDEIRLEAAQNPDSWVGTVIEVDAMSLDKMAKTLRHPRLMRKHLDKRAEQCRLEDIFS